MELYKLINQVQEAVDYSNIFEDKEILSIAEVDHDVLICPIHQSIPEKIFRKLDCEIATTKRRAFLIGITSGDIVINYKGPRRSEIKNFIINYAKSFGNTEEVRLALRDEEGHKSLVYAPINKGVEIAIYGPNHFKCNNKDITDAVNEHKKDCGVNIESLVQAVEKEFDVEHKNQIPKIGKHIKNRRGILYSCNTGKPIFEMKKKIKKVRVPMIYDESQESNVPSTTLLGFGEFQNFSLQNDGYYIGDFVFTYYPEEEKEAKKFLKDKGKTEWDG